MDKCLEIDQLRNNLKAAEVESYPSQEVSIIGLQF